MNRPAIIALVGVTLTSFEISAQRARRPAATPPAGPAVPRRIEHAVPFTVGETLTYDVSWSAYVTAGTAVATVKEKKPSFNSTAYYVVAEGRPTPLVSKLYSLYYKMDSLIDSYTLLPQRGSIYSEEGKRHRFRTTLFDRRANTVHFEYQVEGTAKADFAVSPVAQDALSAIYVLRAVPFKAGERMTMPICDNGTNDKLQVDITGPESVRTGRGNVNALRLNLTLFDARNQRVGRNTAMWSSDDARRLPVQLRADLPIGSFNLVLREAR
ncbi:MAG: hypothetical protein AUF76_11635 [Acidobacteria bacterium 13_1_20CM_2_65_9]|nr:MAG: hypothetical protein AUF76_11635 [Acidobacteria bacterium 13_1_20CM_2_65_9]